MDAHTARRDRPRGRSRDGVQPQRLRRAALGRAGQERRGLNLQALRAGSAAREDEQIPRLVPRAAPAAARLAVSACSRPRAQLLDPEKLRRRSIQQAVFAHAISNHRSPATRTTTYSTTSGAIRLFRTAYRALGYHTTFCLFDRRDDFANSILRSFRMRAINWSWSTVCFRARRRSARRTRFVELFPALARALV